VNLSIMRIVDSFPCLRMIARTRAPRTLAINSQLPQWGTSGFQGMLPADGMMAARAWSSAPPMAAQSNSNRPV
jgi:hypothetical protein